jgi:hypothetical protein
MALIRLSRKKWPFDNGDNESRHTGNKAPEILTINQKLPHYIAVGHESMELVRRKSYWFKGAPVVTAEQITYQYVYFDTDNFSIFTP